MAAPMMVIVVVSILFDLTHDAWVEWRRFLWGDLVLRVWEKRLIVLRRRQ